MPMRSKAQNAAMHAAKQGKSIIGIPQSVGAKFVAASKGQNVSALPQKRDRHAAKPRAGRTKHT